MLLQKKVPMRRCTGCGKSAPKTELIRVVVTPENEIILDATGKKSGRGAYICHSIKCLNAAKKSKRFEKTLKTEIPNEIYEALEAQLKSDG